MGENCVKWGIREGEIKKEIKLKEQRRDLNERNKEGIKLKE